MIESKDIRKMVEHVIRRQRGVVDSEPMDPAREWVTGILVTLLFVCVGGVVSYRYYSSTIAWEASMDAVVAPTVLYNALQVEEALSWYEAREEKYQELRGVMPAETPTSISLPAGDEASLEATSTPELVPEVELVPAAEIPVDPDESVGVPDLSV